MRDDTDLIREALSDAIEHRRGLAAMCPGDCMCRGWRCDECWEHQQLAEDYEELLDLLDARAHEDGPPPRPESTVPVRDELL